MSRESPSGTKLHVRTRRAIAALGADRERALGELEGCFRNGSPPGDLEGPMTGRLLTTTVGYGLDPIFMAIAGLWMPWRGKAFAHGAAEGRNLFTSGFRVPLRIWWPRYHDKRPERTGGFSTFRFDTWTGPGAMDPTTKVGKIDYGHAGSPWLVRDVLDEVVDVGDGMLLGQALLRWRGEFRRAAWFTLVPNARGA